MATTYTDNGTNTPNGSHLIFSYTYPVLESTDVKVALNGVTQATTKYAVDNASSPTKITFNNTSIDATVQESTGAPKTGVTVRVYRDTDVDGAFGGVFAAGSSIRAQDLNNNHDQFLFASQEQQNQPILAEHIEAGAVTTAKIADANVTTVKIADLNVTTGKIAADAITAAKIGDDVINSEHYAAGSIDTEHIADSQVTSAKIADGTIVTADLANAAVTGAKIADGTIITTKYGALSIDETAIGTGVVSNSKLAANAVTTAKIADNAVTGAKIATGAITTTKYGALSINVSAIGTGVVATDKIAADAITGAKIADNAIDSEHYVDGSIDTAHIGDNQVTTAKIPDDAVTTAKLADAELTTLAGMQSGTASILASGTALAATLGEINTICDGKTVDTGINNSSSHGGFATGQAVREYVLAITQAAGGFYPITNEVSFPNANPDPNDDAGTVVSIADAGGIVVNGSGVSTTGRTLGGATVTINGIDSSLYSTTIAAGKGMLVQTTSTLNTYDYHRLVVDEAGVAAAQTLVSDFNERYRIGSSNPSSNNDDGDLFFNTSSDKMLVYNATGSSWDEVQSVGNFFINTISSYSGTGGNSASFNGAAYRFVLSNPGANAQQHIVSVNGVIQKPTTGTSQPAEGFAIDGSSILFSSAPATGSDYFIITVGAAVGIGTPSDNTVDTDIIQNLAVTQAKLAAEAVNEAKLQVSNAPTNGYLLSAQSGNTGGLTWVVAPSGTTNLSATANGTSLTVESSTGTNVALPAVTTSAWGVMSDEDKTKLDGIATGATAYNTPTTTRGDIIYRGASADARLAKGTDGQFLKIGANDPVWADVVGAVADGCIYENSQTISNNYTIASGKGAHSVGPITVSATVTVNGNWVVS